MIADAAAAAGPRQAKSFRSIYLSFSLSHQHQRRQTSSSFLNFSVSIPVSQALAVAVTVTVAFRRADSLISYHPYVHSTLDTYVSSHTCTAHHHLVAYDLLSCWLVPYLLRNLRCYIALLFFSPAGSWSRHSHPINGGCWLPSSPLSNTRLHLSRSSASSRQVWLCR